MKISYNKARDQLPSLMDLAVQEREVIFIHHRSGEDVALIAADELQSLLETAHLLRSSKNAEKLLTALSRARGQGLSG